jgi:hypothetical protein
MASGAEVKDLSLVEVSTTASGYWVGAVVGCNYGQVTTCSSTGSVTSTQSDVGGLVGWNYSGTLTACSSTCEVRGYEVVGGLVGFNGTWYRNDRPAGSIKQCYSTGSISGTGWGVGGLVGAGDGTMTQCYSTGKVSGGWAVGGLVGCNYKVVTQCYSTGKVSGGQPVGGLIGELGIAVASFWDTQTSGQATSAGSTGKTTAEMHAAAAFLETGWDFVGETANGTEDIWSINEGKDYPRLWWELDVKP